MAAKFYGELVAELQEDGETWELQKELLYVSDIPILYYKDKIWFTVCVPKGFKTDFASVPRLPFAYLLAGDTAHKAAVVHDYLYENGIGDKATADKIFLEAMLISGVPAWRARLMYWAVCIGGKGKFVTDEVANGT